MIGLGVEFPDVDDVRADRGLQDWKVVALAGLVVGECKAAGV